ncbi:MAG: ABC transporter ATP-binding protein [Firmicutes bacterium]|nr:ABC transporter ATP-binding protein [Bacillota bacterium]
MKRMLAFLKDYKKESILAPAFKMLEAFFDLLVPLVVADIIDVGIAQGNNSYVIKRVLILVLLAFVGLVCSITAQYFAARASVGFSTGLRQALFDHIQNLSYSKTDKLGTSTLMTRLTSDINQAQNGVNMGLRLLLRSPFIVFGSMIMAFTIDAQCALVFAVAIPVLSIVVYGIMIITIPLYRKVQGKLDVVTGLTRENLTGVRVIRAFRKEPDQVRDFDRSNIDLTKTNEFVGRISSLMNPLTYVLINLATIFLIRQGAVRVNLGSLQQGDVVALYNYMAQMIVELVKLASLIITINRAIACMGRVSRILETDTGMEYPDAVIQTDLQTADPKAQKGTVRFDHVTFTYDGAGAPSLTDISFTAGPGQTIGIIGGTGSGKSSLANLIPRFYDTTDGTVYVDGQDVKSYPKGELISRIGIVPQKAELFSGTIRENLLWGNPDADDEALWDAVRTAQAEEVVLNKDNGLDARVEQNGRNLSGGQRQRLTIARALVKKPEILILDDSASALDFATDAALRKAIHSMDGNTTVFIVSQRASSIIQADCILVLDDGMLAGMGTHDELMQNCAVYQEIYYSQFPEQKPDGREVPAV